MILPSLRAELARRCGKHPLPIKSSKETLLRIAIAAIEQRDVAQGAAESEARSGIHLGLLAETERLNDAALEAIWRE